jgi:hypothetical protein
VKYLDTERAVNAALRRAVRDRGWARANIGDGRALFKRTSVRAARRLGDVEARWQAWQAVCDLAAMRALVAYLFAVRE